MCLMIHDEYFPTYFSFLLFHDIFEYFLQKFRFDTSPFFFFFDSAAFDEDQFYTQNLANLERWADISFFKVETKLQSLMRTFRGWQKLRKKKKRKERNEKFIEFSLYPSKIAQNLATSGQSSGTLEARRLVTRADPVLSSFS